MRKVRIEELGEVEDLGDVELPPEVSVRVNRMIAEADAEIDTTRVNFRWGADQLQMVRRVADMLGVPYQTYIKDALLRQAADDFQRLAPLAKAATAAPLKKPRGPVAPRS